MDFDHAVAEQMYRPLAARYAAFYFGLPPPVPAVMGQIRQESAFNKDAVSPAGARGPGQIMPATGKWISEVNREFGEPRPHDPEWAVRATVWYDKFLFDRVKYKNECDRWGAALSAYNGGLGWHNKRRGRAEDPQDFWGSVRGINPGITDGNQRENFDYPHKIIFKHQPQFVRVGDKKICIN